MDSKELKEAKLQSIEEKLAHYEDLYNRGELSERVYETLISEGRKEAERVKEIGNVEPDEEHAEAREIWDDVQKQFVEGKLSKEEFERYKKMFEHYQFDAPKSPFDILSKIPYPKGSEILPGYTAEETRNLALTREYHRMRREDRLKKIPRINGPPEINVRKELYHGAILAGIFFSVPVIIVAIHEYTKKRR